MPLTDIVLALVVVVKDGSDEVRVTTDPLVSVVVLSVTVVVEPLPLVVVVVHSVTVEPSTVVHHAVTVSVEPELVVKESVHAVTDIVSPSVESVTVMLKVDVGMVVDEKDGSDDEMVTTEPFEVVVVLISTVSMVDSVTPLEV